MDDTHQSHYWAHQHGPYECGPVALYNLQLWDGGPIRYSMRTLIRACKCEGKAHGTKHVDFGRFLCEMGAAYGWKVGGKRKNITVDYLVQKWLLKTKLVMVLNFKMGPVRHYSMIENYDKENGVFSCINWEGVVRKPQQFVGHLEMHAHLDKAVVWVVKKMG